MGAGFSFVKGERKGVTAGERRAAGSERVARAAGAGPATEGALCVLYSRLAEPPAVINQVSTRGSFPCVFFLFVLELF